ncbi:uncharacterized protein MONOS_10391 [Monocercomonoides exilis]|uniref:uncharacterized protein n=1 Tax=Monocercomonoides exilis TaxID=2049356 RepID=UPI00355ABE72|nr:hypothetical protein MONOS_10391 [Monocercomonoides exilis]|eukprot:MONOS_10391.1-p1 / transcript=MONOS_10391.1 / gene=MONOS_10391 / organism=Monocercomonoides_exilis_PA203 / gene_product=unspecified product / transcript_product=unspecified product / location=Mono_scaffold00471:17692-21227(-) / protein_length=1032 / sequence_SO=supercontig / SO=protein_coding / is_pseudo=false
MPHPQYSPTGEERLDSLFSSSGNITIGGFLFDLEKVGYVCVIRSTDGFLKIRECDFRINNNSKDIGILAKIKGELIVKCIQLYGCGEVVRSEAVLFVISHVLSSMKVEDVSIDGVSIVNGDMLQIIDDITPVESFNEDLKLNASKYSRNFIFQDNEQIAFEVSNISFKNIVFSSTSVVNSFRTATSEKASVINSSAGALIIIGGYANLIECEFINNAINSVGYTSVRRNILCDSGALSFDSYSDESGIKDPNLLLDGEYLEMWIQNSGCSINSSLNWSSEESGDLSEETLKEFPQKTYLFCRPHVLTTMRIDEDDKTIIHFKGNNLLPCLVSYELFSLNVSDENARMQEISLSFVTCTYINQDENAIETSKSQLQSAFDLTNIQIWVRAVLSLKENALSKKHSNGVRVIKTEPVLLQDVIEQPNDTSKSSAKAFPWWIILIIVGVLIIAVIIAVIVIVKKKRSNKWKGIEIRDINEECEEKGLTGMNENDKQGIAINPVNKTISKRDNSSIVIQSSKVSNVDGDGINKKQLNNSSPASTNPFENTPGLANDSPNEEYNECSSADISGNSSFLESFESLYPNGQNTDNLSFKQGSTDLLSVSSTAALLANENNSVAQSLDLSQSNNGFMSKNFSVAENDSFSDELKEDIMSKLLMTSMMRNALPKNEITGDSQDVLTEISAACPAFASHENIDLKRDSEQMANPSQRKRKKKGKKGTHRRGAKLNDVQPENEKEETGCEGILLKNTVAMVEKNNGSDNIESVNFKSPEYYHASSSASSTPFSLFGDDDKATEDSELKQCNNLSENTKNIIRTDTILDDTVSVNTLSASFKQTTPDNPVDSAQSGQGEVNTRCCNMESENPPVADGERKQERLRKKKKKKKVEKSTSEQSGDPAIHVNNNIEEQEQKETDQFSALNAVHDKSSSDQNCSVEKPKDGDSEALNAHNFTDIKSDKEQTKENAINSPEEFLVNENIIPDKLKKKKKKKKKKLQKQQKEESNGELPDVNSTLFDESKNEKFSSSEGPTVTKTDIFDI